MLSLLVSMGAADSREVWAGQRRNLPAAQGGPGGREVPAPPPSCPPAVLS